MISIDKAFPLPLDGRFVGAEQWKLLAPFEYNNPPVKVKIPIDFISDGFSIPKIAWSLIGSPWGKGARAALPHDWGYHSQTKSRKEVDKDFLDGMHILGVSWWRRRTMWLAVRGVAWICWNQRKKELNLIKDPF